MLKTRERQQPQDKFEVQAYNKPLYEFKDSGIKAGNQVSFKYYASTVYPDYLITTDEGVFSREPSDVPYHQVTGLVGGFSIQAGEEVIWMEIQGNYESFVRGQILDIEVKKPKKVKKPVKKTKKKK